MHGDTLVDDLDCLDFVVVIGSYKSRIVPPDKHSVSGNQAQKGIQDRTTRDDEWEAVLYHTDPVSAHRILNE
jgi:hypothetical protein